MYEIFPSRLWAGNIRDARDVRNVLNLGVEAIVDLACNEMPVTVPRDITYLRFPVIDATGNSPQLLRLAVETTVTLIGNEIPVFVFCSAGISRTPAILAAAIAIARRRDADTVLKELGEQMPHDVLPGLWNEVKEACLNSHV